MGIEPTLSAWKAEALPLCNIRIASPHGFEPRLTGPKPVVLPLDERDLVPPVRFELTLASS